MPRREKSTVFLGFLRRRPLVSYLLFILVVLLFASSTSFVPVLLPIQQKQQYKSMGALFSSLFLNETSSQKKKKQLSAKKLAKVEKAEAWKAVADEFVKQLLAPSFLSLPVRGSTVEAASQYPSSNAVPALMPGTHKHLGGAYDPVDGCIYGVPANSRSILCLVPEYDDDKNVVRTYTPTSIPLPDSVANVSMKWLRGIFAHGYLWAIPSWAPAVLCVDIAAWRGRRALPVGQTDYVLLLGLPPEHPTGLRWQWHGAGINHEGTAIFCIPSNAKAVLKVDLIHKTTSFIPIQYSKSDYPNFDLSLQNKWYGGIVGADNAVYGIPYRSGALLRIDAKTETATLIGSDYGNAQYNWHGGIQVNGKIYAHPSHADTVLVVDTNRHGVCSELPICRADYDKDTRKNYKWLGGSVGADGNIYCPACDTSAVLKIDTKTDECTTFGFAGTDKNKWQGGLRSSRDGCVYCIPANGKHVLRIYTNPLPEGVYEAPIQLVGDLPPHKDKWQGGSEGKDGCLYFVPENGYRILKVTPPEKPPPIVDGKLPEHDIKIEFL